MDKKHSPNPKTVLQKEIDGIESTEDINLLIAAAIAIKENPTKFKNRMSPFICS